MNYQPAISTVLSISLTFAFIACDRREPAGPELQTTDGPQARQDPVTVTGCLNAGVLAESTFVLTVSESSGGSQAGTYQLSSAQNVNLKDYVGQEVTVNGIVRAQQQIVSQGAPVEERPARGTSGTPTVETKSEVDVKQLQVTSMTPTGKNCEK